MSRTFRMLIGGRLVDGDAGVFGVINPSTGKTFANCPAATQQQLDAAVSSARAAFPKWAALSSEQRKEHMLAGAAAVKAKAGEMAEVLVREQGKPLHMAQGEVAGVVGYMQYFANQKFEFEKVIVDNKKETVIQKRAPLGVVGGITPWNFPPLMGAWKMAEALATGNTMILKPSPYTPLTSLMLGEAVAEALPPGVFNVVTGGDDVGKWLTQHPGVAKISFTGSTATGKAIQAATSGTLKRLTLELGGNDAAILLDDVDPKVVGPKVFDAAMKNTGQVCIAVKRVYVHESKFDAVVKEFTRCAKEARVGDGFEKGVQFGPVNNKMQFDKVRGLVDDAKARGATIHAGGEPLARDGYFYPPTVITGVQEGTRIVDEEQFGPVVPLMPFSSTADAVARANATQYGLGASVWSNDTRKAAEVGSLLDAGTVWVNGHGILSPDVPFGGAKESGVGRQMGEATLEGYTEMKVIRIPKMKASL